MQIEFLGSGGAVTTPRPGCQCKLCVEARTKGIPYSRTGPSTFVHGPNVLIDTPEDIKEQLNRSHVTEIAACFYSHWHPDHIMGRRVWETMNADWLHWPPTHHRTDIYLPQQVALDVRERMGIWEHLMYLQRFGVINVIEMKDGDTVTLNGVTIRPFRVAQDYVYAFLFEENDKRVLIAPDELYAWQPPADVQGVDLAVIPMGLSKFHPLTGERLAPDDHPVFQSEATFEQTMEIVDQLKASRVIMTHIEEPDLMGYDECLQLEARLHSQGYNISFAYDTMMIEV